MYINVSSREGGVYTTLACVVTQPGSSHLLWLPSLQGLTLDSIISQCHVYFDCSFIFFYRKDIDCMCWIGRVFVPLYTVVKAARQCELSTLRRFRQTDLNRDLQESAAVPMCTFPWVFFSLSQWVDLGRLRGHPTLLKHLPKDFKVWVTQIESLHLKLGEKMKRCAIYWSSLYQARGKGRTDKTKVIPLVYHKATEIFPLGVIVSPMIFHLLCTSTEELITLCDIIHQTQTSEMQLLLEWGGILLKIKILVQCIRYEWKFEIRTKPFLVEILLFLASWRFQLNHVSFLARSCWEQLDISNPPC